MTYLKLSCRPGYCLPPGVKLLGTPKACDSRVPFSGISWSRSNEPRELEEAWAIKPRKGHGATDVSENARRQQAGVCSALEIGNSRKPDSPP